MKIGFMGCHRTGKTTTALALAEKLDIPYIKTSATDTLRRLGVPADKTMSFSDRLWVQGEILKDAIKVWSSEDRFVTDRTPLCMIGYVMADITSEPLSSIEEDVLFGYIDLCKAATEHFTDIFMLRPGIPYIEDDSKEVGFSSRAYIAKLDAIMRSLVLSDSGLKCDNAIVFDKDCTDLDKRVQICFDQAVWCQNSRDADESSTAFVSH